MDWSATLEAVEKNLLHRGATVVAVWVTLLVGFVTMAGWFIYWRGKRATLIATTELPATPVDSRPIRTLKRKLLNDPDYRDQIDGQRVRIYGIFHLQQPQIPNWKAEIELIDRRLGRVIHCEFDERWRRWLNERDIQNARIIVDGTLEIVPDNMFPTGPGFQLKDCQPKDIGFFTDLKEAVILVFQVGRLVL